MSLGRYHLRVVTPGGCVFDDDVCSVTLRTTNGDIGILKGHIDYFSAIVTSAVSLLDKDEKPVKALCGGGFVRVDKTGVNVVTDVFLLSDEIDRQSALKEAEELRSRLLSAADERELYILKDTLRRAEIKVRITE